MCYPCLLHFVPVSGLVWFPRRSCHELILEILHVVDRLGLGKDHRSIPESKIVSFP